MPAEQPPYTSLRRFMAALEQQGALRRISVPVASQLELPGVVRQVSSHPDGGPALLFERPDNGPLPVAANLFGSAARVCQALGIDRPEQLTAALAALLPQGPLQPEQLTAALAAHPALTACRPVDGGGGPCHTHQDRTVDLTALPIPQNWPLDGSAAGTGRYLTLGQVITADPAGGEVNCGIYRCQIHDPVTLAVRWKPGSGAARHHQRFSERGQRMPVAIALGGPPALTLASAWPLPDGLDEYRLAGWLLGGPLATVACSHGPLPVPAEAELVLEGFADPDMPLIEGPFGNHTGSYAAAGPAARVTVHRSTRRTRPVLPVTMVGPPPQEDCWMMLGWERLLAALLPRLVPGVREIRFPLAWVFRNSAVISLDTSSPRMVRDIVQALWRLPWFASSRLLVLVDDAAAAADPVQAAWRVVNETDWNEDLIRDEAGGRLALDATRKNPAAGLADAATASLITRRWKEYGLP